MARPKKTERENAQMREHILESAAEVIALKGFDGASMAEIAAVAGHSPPTLYVYFDGKAGLLRLLGELLQEEAAQLFDVPVPDGLTLSQRLQLVLMHQARWVMRRRSLFMLMNRPGALAQLDPDHDPFEVPPYVGQLAEWLVATGSGDDFGPYDAQTAALIAWGISRAFFVRWLAADPASEDLVALMGDVASITARALVGA